MNGIAIQLSGVSKSYRPSACQQVTAVDAVDLRIEKGSAVAVTGPSGSGKSTLLHLIGAMDRPDAGEIAVNGVRVDQLTGSALNKYRRKVGFVFQAFHLLPTLSALDNVIAPVLPRRADFDKVKRARELLTAIGLTNRERAVPAELSGGEQQRVAIARALVSRPEILLADEPTGNLDSAVGHEIVDLLLRFRDSDGMTLVIATHNVEVAASCDRVIVVHDGRIVSDDQVVRPDPAQVLNRIGRLT